MHKILFLHHSTGQCIWIGDMSKYTYRINGKGSVQMFFEDYNNRTGKEYVIEDLLFPRKQPYGWKNYPYDFYNIWVRNGGSGRYLDEPTLEILTASYNVIIIKHCFPVGRIMEENGNADIASEEKRLGNYKLQYKALKEKMHSFPTNKFIVWTPPASVKGQVTPDEAKRTYEFYRWILDEWDEKNDNIFIWDFYGLETEGELYLKEEYASGPRDSHPGRKFSGRVSPLFCQFIIDVIETRVQ